MSQSNSTSLTVPVPDQQKKVAELFSVGARSLAEMSTKIASGEDLGKAMESLTSQYNAIKAAVTPHVIIQSRSPSWANKPDPVPPTISLMGCRIGSVENVTVTIGNPGYCKTTVAQSLVASKLNPSCDALGFQVLTDRPVIYIDTEQSWEDHWNSWERTMRRAGVKPGDPVPSSVEYHWVRHMTPEQRQGFVYSVIKTKKPGVLIIDGIADLLGNVNDPDGSCELVSRILSELSSNAVSMFCTIHGNAQSSVKEDKSQKARGWIGSEIMRKAECVLLLQKTPDGTRKITTEFVNGKNRSDSDSINASFRWSDEHRMMVSCEAPPEQKQQPAAGDRYTELIAHLSAQKHTADGHGPWSYTELIDAINKFMGKTRRSASGNFEYMHQHNLITKTGDSWYIGQKQLDLEQVLGTI
jgi:hypothetical protein